MKPTRIFLAVLLLCLVSLIVFLLSSLYSSFNVGADVKDIFHVDVSTYETHQPYVEWLEDDSQIYGAINPYLRKDITTAYLNAWKVLNISLNKADGTLLKDHFIKNQVKKISHNLKLHESFSQEQIDLSHRLKLHFLSFDKTVVSFSDSGAWIRRNINDAGIDEENDYLVTMCLVDGRWLINGMTRNRSTRKNRVAPRISPAKHIVSSMSGLNYYPKDFPWMDFWLNYDRDIIAQDFARMKEMDFKLVRFFIPFEIFGAGSVKREMLEHMDHFVQTAAENDISLMPCLFDFPIGYGLEKYTQYDRQLEVLLTRYKDESAIIGWDLKNELDRDFDLQGKNTCLAWLDFIINRARTYTDQPLTVGWSMAKYAMLKNKELDWISFHFYEDMNVLASRIEAIQARVKKPIVISEFGLSTYSGIWPGGGSVAEQEALYKKMHAVCKEKQVASIAWCLYDYPIAPSEVFGRKPWVKAKQKYFGILDKDGKAKW